MIRKQPERPALKTQNPIPAITVRSDIPLHLLAVGLIVAAVFVAFLPALLAGFVNWDDPSAVRDNKIIRDLAWPNVKWMFTHYHMGHYQPLALLTLALDYRLWGLEPFGYHLTSVALHALNAAMFYLLAVSLLRLSLAQPAGPTPAVVRSKSPSHTILIGALAAALLFAIHPLRVESVAWITERRDVLSASFYLAATLAYLQAHTAGKHAGRTQLWLLASVLLITLSLLTRVIAVTAVAVFLLLDFYPLRRLGADRGWLGPAARRVWLEKALFVVPSIVIGVVTIRAQAASSAWRGIETFGVLKPALGGLFGLSFYLWKTVLPTGLSPYYEMPLDAAGIDLRFVIAGVAVLAAGVPLLIWGRRRPGVLIAWACYLVLIFPVLGVLHNWPQVAADRYTYLPCMGFAVLAGAGVARLASAATGRSPRYVLLAPMVVVAIALGGLTWRQAQVWSNPFTLWERVLAIEPGNYYGRLNYGQALLDAHQPEKAAAQFKKAVELRPAYSWPWTNLGLALIEMQQHSEAVPPLRRALELDPTDSRAHAAMGVVLNRTGDPAAGMDHLKKAVELEPDDASIRANLGWYLRRQGELDQAIRQLKISVELSPENARHRHELASALEQDRQYNQAIAVLRQGLALSGRDPNLLDALAKILATCPDPACREPREAVQLAEEACRRTEHRVPQVLETLAIAYEAAGQRSDAAGVLRSAIALAEEAGEKQTAQRCRDHLTRVQKDPS